MKKRDKLIRYQLLRNAVSGGVPLVPVGTIFDRPTFPALTGFTVQGSGISLVSNYVQMTGGIATFGDRLVFSDAANSYNVTCLEKWTQRCLVQTPTAINASSYGIGIGVNSISTEESSTSFRWVWDTAFNPGKIICYTQRSTINQIIGVGSFTPIANTQYIIEVERAKNVFTVRIYNSTGLTLHLTETFTLNLSSGYVQAHNTGRFCIQNFGGTNCRINSWTVSSSANRNVDCIFIGDSNTYGMFATSNALRYVEQSCTANGKTFEVLAGYADRATDVTARIDEVLALAKATTVVYINLLTNDVRAGTAGATYQAAINTMISAFEGAGLTVVLIVPIALQGFSMVPVETFYNGKPNLKVNFFQATKNVGDTNPQAIYMNGDLLHLNVLGNTTVAGVLTPLMP